MLSDNPSVEVKTEESASSSNQTERTPALLSLAEQDHLFRTLVVPQRLPELCFSGTHRVLLITIPYHGTQMGLSVLFYGICHANIKGASNLTIANATEPSTM
ncbi:hypothetical protein ARMGADRAFT_1087638 [Armillaria gallica]|uniref:Uncharacterized protein n=1 Tax=Armillaria gallica TaxID=47427 RepID=A0A2H3CQ38_ARMGA|nr:hypothetical protein ARMGADRAFT_1087638 [Armillaria gallica]